MKKVSLYSILIIFIAVAFVTISFASFNTNLYVNGSGVLRAQAEIRVTNIVNKAYHGEAIENFNPNFDVDKTNVSVNLPTSNSSVEYTVTVKNYGDRAFLPEIKVLSEVNPNVVITISDGTTTYNLPNNNMNYEFAANEEKTFTITISNKPGTTNNNVVVSLEYEFMHDDVTAPGIAKDGNNVAVAVPGTSTFAVDHYEYYYNTSGTTPNDNASSNGNTNGTLSINAINEGHYFIWYRTVSTKNTKSVWSNRVEVIKAFTLTYNVNNNDAEECNPGTVTKNYGTSWGTLCAPEATGYTFNSWNTKANGSGTTITASSVVEDDVTVYAQWNTNKYLVTLNGNNGIIGSQSGWTLGNENTTATKNVYYKAIIGTLPTATRSGYTFMKWNTNQNGSGTRCNNSNGSKCSYCICNMA